MSVESISWWIPITPVAKGRPRFCVRGKFVSAYTDKKTREYEKNVLSESLSYAPKRPLTGAISATMVFYMTRPKSLAKSVKHHVKKADLDNLIKAILDPLNKVFFNDDSQIIHISASKCYATDKVGISIVLQEIE